MDTTHLFERGQKWVLVISCTKNWVLCLPVCLDVRMFTFQYKNKLWLTAFSPPLNLPLLLSVSPGMRACLPQASRGSGSVRTAVQRWGLAELPSLQSPSGSSFCCFCSVCYFPSAPPPPSSIYTHITHWPHLQSPTEGGCISSWMFK